MNMLFMIMNNKMFIETFFCGFYGLEYVGYMSYGFMHE